MFTIRHESHRTGVHTCAVTASSGTPGPPYHSHTRSAAGPGRSQQHEEADLVHHTSTRSSRWSARSRRRQLAIWTKARKYLHLLSGAPLAGLLVVRPASSTQKERRKLLLLVTGPYLHVVHARTLGFSVPPQEMGAYFLHVLTGRETCQFREYRHTTQAPAPATGARLDRILGAIGAPRGW